MENIFELSVGAGLALLLIKEFVSYSNNQKKERDMQVLESRLNKLDVAVEKISLSLEKLVILSEIAMKERK